MDTQFVRPDLQPKVASRCLGGHETCQLHINKLRAGAGQTLTVDLKGSNLHNYFNVMAAGSENALFIGSSSGNSFRGLPPSDGDVRVRVYLMPTAALLITPRRRCPVGPVMAKRSLGVMPSGSAGPRTAPRFLFVQGNAVASDQPAPLALQRRGDFSLLRLGENLEVYEIVDALVLGGS
jgi:hypothetical protein